MKAFLLLCGAVITVTGACLGFAQDEAKPKAAASQPAKADNKQATSDKDETPKPSKAEALSPATKGDAVEDKGEAGDDDESRISVPAKYAADEKAIRDTHRKLIEAYCADDAKAVAALFSEEGEYINAAGELFQGRDDIESTLKDFMEDHPG